MIDPDCFRDPPLRPDRGWSFAASVLGAIIVTALLFWAIAPHPTLDVGPIPQVEARP